ncbi:MAG: ATP-binding protein [Cyanobacteriota bacterium]|nr:ATP-binding protein [Cyanobacteriota bacterium]
MINENLKEQNNDDELIFAPEDDELVFAEENEDDEGEVNNGAEAWKVMLVDDDEQVHQVTKLALRDFSFEGKPLKFFSAFSAGEARQLIPQYPDLAFIFLDVVMESNNAGLELVKYIREELNNRLVRIVLRTGQPGEAPETSAIVDYDINDYKIKTELTQHRLVTTTIGALRSYRDIMEIEKNRKTLAVMNNSLKEQASDLSQALRELQQTQLQLIQKEKMAFLGQLITGVAHEINNPVGYIFGNLAHAEQDVVSLIKLLEIYQEKFPNPGEDIEEKLESMEIDYVVGDLPDLIDSMKEGTVRIAEISKSLRNFARADTTEAVLFDIHEGMDSTLKILKYRLKANPERPEIEVIKNYGNFPVIKCYPGQLNQVFMNLIANAIDALEEGNQERSYEEIKSNPNRIAIATELNEKENTILIRIKDNGIGMSQEVKEKIFEHLFTTKPAGKGTGLGLSISRQFVEEKHGGSLTCISELGEGTEFRIEIPANY